MSLKDNFENMISQKDKIIVEMVANLFRELTQRTPVDTGTLKSAWQIDKVGDGWILSNNMQYADTIFNGRRFAVDKMIGSKQLPDGVYPILQQFNNELNKRLEDLNG